jgi:CHAT domain-containing protein
MPRPRSRSTRERGHARCWSFSPARTAAAAGRTRSSGPNTPAPETLARQDGGAGRTGREGIRGRRDELLRRYAQAREELRARGSGAGATAPTSTLEAAQIRALLDPGTVLLEYRLGDAESFLWAVTAAGITTYRLPDRATLEADARLAYELVAGDARQSRRRAEKLLASLSAALLAPPADLLAGAARIAIVADGALQMLPFAALPDPADPGEPLIAGHQMVCLPSATTLAALRAEAAGRRPPPGLLAVVADPVFGGGDPRLERPAEAATAPYRRLENSAEEAAAILALAPPERRFSAVGFDARRELVDGGVLAGYRIVHFATHGDFDDDRPELSRLVLSLVDRDGAPHPEGLLHAHELAGVDLPAELVVLSACRTALGREVRGEGLVGLTHAFMNAGTSRVVVSLWSVGDEPTAELMEHFYRALLTGGEAPAAALRQAQNALRRQARWQAPRYWAGFALHGDWRDLAR